MTPTARELFLAGVRLGQAATVEPTGTTFARWRSLLESTRQYAHEKLRERGEHDTTARSHALALLALAERFDSSFDGISDRLWAEQVKPELDNCRAALEWALGSRSDLEIGHRLAASLSAFWFVQAAPLEGWRWVRAALQVCDAKSPSSTRAKLDLAEARIAAGLSHAQVTTPLAAAERAFQFYQQADDRLGMAEAQLYIAFGLIYNGRVADGEGAVRAALAIARACGARRLIAPALHVLGKARYFSGDLAAARGFYLEALTVYRGAGRERPAAVAAGNVAEVEFQGGN